MERFKFENGRGVLGEWNRNGVQIFCQSWDLKSGGWWVGGALGSKRIQIWPKGGGGRSSSKMGVRTNREHVWWSTRTDKSVEGLDLVLFRYFLRPGGDLNPNVQYQ